jgi:hypothetical protein
MLWGAAAHAATVPLLTLTADPQPLMTITVKNAAFKVRVSTGFERGLALNFGPADAAKLKALPIFGKRHIEDPLIPGGSATFRGNLYAVSAPGLGALITPTLWVDKAVDTSGTDGIVSVMALDADRIVIAQPAAPKGGQVYVIPTTGSGDVAGELKIADRKVSVRLALDAPRTMMNANGAQALFDAGLVKRGGTVGLWSPFPQVALPYETLKVVPGATVFGLPLRSPAARVTEARAREIDSRAQAGTSTEADQDDAIVVSAKTPKGNKNPPWVLIGRDILDACSSIELDKPNRRWLLTCNFGG